MPYSVEVEMERERTPKVSTRVITAGVNIAEFRTLAARRCIVE